MSADFSIFEFFGHSGGPLSKKSQNFQKNFFSSKKKQMGLFHLPFSHFQKTIEIEKNNRKKQMGLFHQQFFRVIWSYSGGGFGYSLLFQAAEVGIWGEPRGASNSDY